MVEVRINEGDAHRLGVRGKSSTERGRKLNGGRRGGTVWDA